MEKPQLSFQSKRFVLCILIFFSIIVPFFGIVNFQDVFLSTNTSGNVIDDHQHTNLNKEGQLAPVSIKNPTTNTDTIPLDPKSRVSNFLRYIHENRLHSKRSDNTKRQKVKSHLKLFETSNTTTQNHVNNKKKEEVVSTKIGDILSIDYKTKSSIYCLDIPIAGMGNRLDQYWIARAISFWSNVQFWHDIENKNCWCKNKYKCLATENEFHSYLPKKQRLTYKSLFLIESLMFEYGISDIIDKLQKLIKCKLKQQSNIQLKNTAQDSTIAIATDEKMKDEGEDENKDQMEHNTCRLGISHGLNIFIDESINSLSVAELNFIILYHNDLNLGKSIWQESDSLKIFNKLVNLDIKGTDTKIRYPKKNSKNMIGRQQRNTNKKKNNKKLSASDYDYNYNVSKSAYWLLENSNISSLSIMSIYGMLPHIQECINKMGHTSAGLWIHNWKFPHAQCISIVIYNPIFFKLIQYHTQNAFAKIWNHFNQISNSNNNNKNNKNINDKSPKANEFAILKENIFGERGIQLDVKRNMIDDTTNNDGNSDSNDVSVSIPVYVPSLINSQTQLQSKLASENENGNISIGSSVGIINDEFIQSFLNLNNLDIIGIHWRCGDILKTTSTKYGFMALSHYDNAIQWYKSQIYEKLRDIMLKQNGSRNNEFDDDDIDTKVNTIWQNWNPITSETKIFFIANLNAKIMRAIDRPQFERCKYIADGILPSFSQFFQPGQLIFENKGSINQDFFILTNSKLIICSVSTFCQNAVYSSLDTTYAYGISFGSMYHPIRNFWPSRVYFYQYPKEATDWTVTNQTMILHLSAHQSKRIDKFWLLSGEIKNGGLKDDDIIKFILKH